MTGFQILNFRDRSLFPFRFLLFRRVQTRDRQRARFPKQNPERSIASFVYVSMLWILFSENALGGVSKIHGQGLRIVHLDSRRRS